MIWNHFLLIEAPDALPEDIVLLGEDASSPDVHHGLGREGFWTRRGAELLRRPTVLQPGRNMETIQDTKHLTFNICVQCSCFGFMVQHTPQIQFFHISFNSNINLYYLLTATITYSD